MVLELNWWGRICKCEKNPSGMMYCKCNAVLATNSAWLLVYFGLNFDRDFAADNQAVLKCRQDLDSIPRTKLRWREEIMQDYTVHGRMERLRTHTFVLIASCRFFFS